MARARARWWSTWRRITERLAADGIGEVGRMRGRGVGDDRQRRLQRMGEIAGMAPRFLGLRLAVREELVDLLGQRSDLGREIVADAGLVARADRRRPRRAPGAAATGRRRSAARRGSAGRRRARGSSRTGSSEGGGSARRSSRATARPGTASAPSSRAGWRRARRCAAARNARRSRIRRCRRGAA